jgi:hypothetical protein
MINAGVKNEDEFVYFLNEKKGSELSVNLKNMMERLFGIVDPDKTFYCQKTENYIKPDILITHDNKEVGVSLKYGRSQVVHEEQIKTFILYLRKEGISSRTQQTLLLFQYGDGTNDGTGERRYSSDQVRIMLANRIREANEELNKDKEFIKRFITRIIFDGVNPEAKKADAIYYGDVNYGVTVTRKQMNKLIIKH